MRYALAMPLRILQLNSARLYIGEAAHTLSLTEALRRAGHSVWLGLREGYPTFEAARARGLEPLGLRLPHRFWPPHDLPDLRRLTKWVREHGIQVIHAHRGKEHWQAVLAVKLCGLKVPVVRTRHVVTPLKNHTANRWLARRTARLVTVSAAVAADVRRSGLYRDEQVRFIPGGLDLERFKRAGRREAARAKLGLSPGAPVAICVARFAIVKAHRVLLAAWPAVRKALPDAVLLLVGDGTLREACEAQARELGLGDAVRFLGRRPNEELPELLEAADVGALCSVGSEGFSRAVLEYLALGLPVVGTRVGAVPDLVTDGVSGKLAAPEDAVGLAAALREVLSAAPEQRAAWGAAGRARAEAKHGYATWAAAHEALYREVLPPVS
jgi:glycosyltransferase involved in cell wall biosynthesis